MRNANRASGVKQELDNPEANKKNTKCQTKSKQDRSTSKARRGGEKSRTSRKASYEDAEMTDLQNFSENSVRKYNLRSSTIMQAKATAAYQKQTMKSKSPLRSAVKAQKDKSPIARRDSKKRKGKSQKDQQDELSSKKLSSERMSDDSFKNADSIIKNEWSKVAIDLTLSQKGSLDHHPKNEQRKPIFKITRVERSGRENLNDLSLSQDRKIETQKLPKKKSLTQFFSRKNTRENAQEPLQSSSVSNKEVEDRKSWLRNLIKEAKISQPKNPEPISLKIGDQLQAKNVHTDKSCKGQLAEEQKDGNLFSKTELAPPSQDTIKQQPPLLGNPGSYSYFDVDPNTSMNEARYSPTAMNEDYQIDHLCAERYPSADFSDQLNCYYPPSYYSKESLGLSSLLNYQPPILQRQEQVEKLSDVIIKPDNTTAEFGLEKKIEKIQPKLTGFPDTFSQLPNTTSNVVQHGANAHNNGKPGTLDNKMTSGNSFQDQENRSVDSHSTSYRGFPKLTKSQERLEKIEVFTEVTKLVAGTFKYEKNVYYQPDDQKFSKMIKDQYFEQHRLDVERGNLTPDQVKIQLKEKIKDMRSKLKPNVKFFKMFVPIFPQLYDQIDCSLSAKKNLILYGNIKVEDEENPDGVILHRDAQIKFGILRDCLIKYEESRAKQLEFQQKHYRDHFKNGFFFVDYLLNLDFPNIKRIWLYHDTKPRLDHNKRRPNDQNDQLVNVNLIIQLKKPCEAMKFTPNQEYFEKKQASRKQSAKDSTMEDRSSTSNTFEKVDDDEDWVKPSFISLVRSPLNMLTHGIRPTSLPVQLKEKPNQVEYETLVNYWNLNQVFQMQGTAKKQNIDTFIKTAKKQNPWIELIQTKEEVDQSGIRIIGIEQTKKECQNLMNNGVEFQQQLAIMKPSLRFSFLALLSNSKVNIFSRGITSLMKSLNQGEWNQTESLADLASYIIDIINQFEDLDYKDESYLESIYTKLMQDTQITDAFYKSELQLNLMRQRRVLITPTLLSFTVAKEEESNKVLRKYNDLKSLFLRVSFVNEQFDKGFYFGRKFHNLLGYIHRFIKDGFFIGNSLHATFLNYSNSQFKNHTCWFKCEGGNIKNEQIIKSLGEFNHENNILKRYARRAQNFSTTKKVIDLKDEQVLQGLQDIERNGHVFSDGCGQIHPDLAGVIADQFKFTRVSAFQVRVGGGKGVLAVNFDYSAFQKPHQRSKKDEYQVLLRKSQIKYPSKSLTLDIIRCATFSQGYVNRQLIILLNCLGVPASYFLKLQAKAKSYVTVEEIVERLSSKVQGFHQQFGSILNKEISSSFDAQSTLEKNRKLKDMSADFRLSIDACKSFQATLKQALIKGVDIMRDPIFSNIMYTMQLNQYLSIKKKCRILLPDSCVLMGVVDPTGTLEENEIFIQIRKDSFSVHRHGYGAKKREKRMEEAEAVSSIDSIHKVIEGDVLVTRNPCTHPGDIRRLKCVDNPRLKEMFNVIIFSQKGERPQCNMMSGGDLDGDVYFITWDKELVSYVKPENIHPPADYSKSQLIKEKPESDDIADYFCFYLERDVLGTVSNLWLTLCDYYGEKGPCNENCLALSQMCSVAVDFAKHGECVSRKNFSPLTKIVKSYPDFLEKEGKPMIQSQGVLGQLYRDIKNDFALDAMVENDRKMSICLQYELDQKILNLGEMTSLGVPVMHAYLADCYLRVYLPIVKIFKQIMTNFQLASEGELFSCDLKFRLYFFADVEDKNIYTGDPGSKQEDAIQNLNTLRRQAVEKHTTELRSIVQAGLNKGDASAELHVAQALYLASYFDTRNKSCADYLAMYQTDHEFDVFYCAWKQSQTADQSFLNQLESQHSFYQSVCVEAEQGNLKKLRSLLNCKKLFSIPWLIVSEVLMVPYPDKYDDMLFNAKFKKQEKASKTKPQSAVKVTISKQPQQPQNMSQRLGMIFGAEKENLNPPPQNQKSEQAKQPAEDNNQQSFLDLMHKLLHHES